MVVGGMCLAAALAVFAGARSARWLALAAGGVVFAFIGVELAVMAATHWLQPLTAVAAASIVALARQLPSTRS